MARFFNAHVPEAVQPFWAALQAGEFIADAAVQACTYRKQGTRWVAACGGVRARRGRGLKGRCLCFSEREEIALARARGDSVRAIARRLGRSPSTVSRELRRNADRRGYRATTAHALAYERASRPKPAKLATNLALRRVVQDDLRRRCEKRARRLTLKVTVEQMKVVAATRQACPSALEPGDRQLPQAQHRRPRQPGPQNPPTTTSRITAVDPGWGVGRRLAQHLLGGVERSGGTTCAVKVSRRDNNETFSRVAGILPEGNATATDRGGSVALHGSQRPALDD